MAPLNDITAESNRPRAIPFKRILDHDDDRTVLPPPLSSYARSLLAASRPDHRPATPITGIYELDFPQNSLKPSLKDKLSLTRDHTDKENRTASAHSSYASITTNHHSGSHSLSPNLQRSELQVHSIRKLRGTRRFGKLLGPPKRGANLNEDHESLEPALKTPPPSFNMELSPQAVKTPTHPDVPAEEVLRAAPAAPPRPQGFNFVSLAKGEELRQRIEQQKLLNELERERLRQLERLNKLESQVSAAPPQRDTNLKTPRAPLPLPPPPPPPPQPQLQPRAPPTAPPSTLKKKSITINGIQYEKLELLGRGGLSKVYKVKALSNNKLYAIKKVTFDQFDDACVRGFKGEIDLLIRLKHSDRVVRLVDHAIGEGSIYLVMECGDSDLAHVFQSKLAMTEALDINFVRYHAIEMLRCVLAVHQAGIVHSDLKPANFLFVRGILKIIDFGIANAVPDHTANIYRESQIGTPNYMAPEALIEVNQLFPGLPVPEAAPPGGAAGSAGAAGGAAGAQRNTWKVGMPSDVWLCGCIIYQMIYGKPPYGQYSGNQRIMAIMNPQVRIQYAATGMGGVPVPTSAIELMKRCLARNPHERLTVEECLHSDFLSPKVVNEDFVRDLVHLAVNFGINNRVGGSGIITADIYDKLVETVLKQIDELNYG